MANQHPNMTGLVSFKEGYDERREGNGRKPRAHSLEAAIAKILEKPIKDFFKLVGLECPRQYDQCDSVLDAILLNQSAIAVGSLKGNKQNAVNLLFDRCYGKASQSIEIKSTLTQKDLDAMTDEELRKVANGEIEVDEAY